MGFALKARRQCCWRLRIVYPHLLCTLIPARHVFPTCDARCNSVSDQYSCYPQVTGMLDESKGTLRLARDGLGDARVPSLPLETLKEMYRTGRGSVCSWRATASLANRGTCPTSCLNRVSSPFSLTCCLNRKDGAFPWVSKALYVATLSMQNIKHAVATTSARFVEPAVTLFSMRKQVN